LYTVGYLQTDMNRDNLVGPNQKYHQNFLALQKEFPQQGNDLVVVVESERHGEKPAVCRAARRENGAGNQFVPRRFLPAKPAMMGTKALFFVPTNDLAAIQTTLHDDMPFIRSSRRRQI
jgi:hypothetical protein